MECRVSAGDRQKCKTLLLFRSSLHGRVWPIHKQGFVEIYGLPASHPWWGSIKSHDSQSFLPIFNLCYSQTCNFCRASGCLSPEKFPFLQELALSLTLESVFLFLESTLVFPSSLWASADGFRAGKGGTPPPVTTGWWDAYMPGMQDPEDWRAGLKMSPIVFRKKNGFSLLISLPRPQQGWPEQTPLKLSVHCTCPEPMHLSSGPWSGSPIWAPSKMKLTNVHKLAPMSTLRRNTKSTLAYNRQRPSPQCPSTSFFNNDLHLTSACVSFHNLANDFKCISSCDIWRLGGTRCRGLHSIV